MKFYELELKKAADVLVRDLLQLKEGETFIITADTESNEAVVNATAASAFAIGAKPMVIWTPSPLGVGKAADPMLPLAPLTAALSHADVWVEFNNQWLLYSTPFEKAMEVNKNLRYMCLVGMNEDMMVRTIGRIDNIKLGKFLHAVANKTASAKKMRVTTPGGTDVTFEIEPKHLMCCDDGIANKPGIFMLSGQINVVPKFGSVQGKIVFDGALTPPLGKLNSGIELIVENGIIVEVNGGTEAATFKTWLDSFEHENMYKMAHICYGFNPGAKLTGDIVEDERVWGCTEWGIGYVSPYDAPPVGIDAPSHCDGICLNSSVWLDDEQIMENGEVIVEELKALLK